MNNIITIREYARLTTRAVAEPTLSLAHIDSGDFDWLCQLNRNYLVSHEPGLAQLEDSRTLRLDSYVGVIETPSGQVIEILPKTALDRDHPKVGRELVRRMLEKALDLSPRESGEAALELFDIPLSEWVIARFLTALEHLVKRGVRSDYLRHEATEPFLRGQLDMARQMRQPVGRGHHFALRYDLFLSDRAENRLLMLALEKVAGTTQQPGSWRLAQELRHLLTEVPTSRDIQGDFRQWRNNRLMAHYQGVKPWCELILYRSMPTALHGAWQGISLLFPMEKLFENYVETCLRQQLLAGTKLKSQAANEYLCEHKGDRLFQLRPDLLLIYKERRWVLDVKWKCLDSNDRQSKYGISQGDLYQLFAYGHKYLREQDRGDLVLIYPSWNQLKVPLEPFYYNDRLTLWVLPFELATNLPHGLVLPDSASALNLPLQSTSSC